MTGVYTITNTVNGKMYVGCGLNIYRRQECHYRTLRNGTHRNTWLQKSFKKYGEDKFVFELLVECSKEIMASEEHYWCNLLRTHEQKYGYNVRPTHPESVNMGPLTESAKRKISIARTGMKMPESFGRILSAAKKGVPCHPNTLAALKKLPQRKFTDGDRKKAAESHHRKVLQYSLTFEIIEEFDSFVQLEEKTGICARQAYNCAYKKANKCHGFIFRFSNT